MSFKTLSSISLHCRDSFKDNLRIIISDISNCPDDSLILIPEVAITNFCYDKIKEASIYSSNIIEKISQISKNKSICLTIIEKENNLYFNNAYIFHNQKIVYKRAKNMLFKLGDEHLYFHTDKHQSSFNKYSNIVEIGSLKVGVLICFELRFIDEWKRLLGCDVILIPAQWGENRSEHFKTLSRALALSNQCFVVNANNANLFKCNQIITPFGDVYDGSDHINTLNVNLKDIEKMRKYIVLD